MLQVYDIERDINLVKSGATEENLIYQKVVGLKDDLSGPQSVPDLLDDDASESSDYDDAASENHSSESEDQSSKFVNSSRPSNETAEDKKVSFFVSLFKICSLLVYSLLIHSTCRRILSTCDMIKVGKIHLIFRKW